MSRLVPGETSPSIPRATSVELPKSVQDIKSKVLSALRWTAAARFSAQLITWSITLVVIRILDPSDYALMAMSEVVFSLLLMTSSTGFESALIQAKEVSRLQVRQIFGTIILLNAVLFAALFLVAPWIGAYYRDPRIVSICRVLGAGFLLVPLIAVPSALLSRDIDFKRKSIVELVAAVLSSVTVLFLAYSGLGEAS